MKKGACYIRVSTDMQTEFSPDSQLNLIRKYAENNDIELLEEHIYKDEGISGTNADKRPQFQRMIANARSKDKPFDVILVYDFSRFARSREQSVVYKNILRKKDIQLISITQPLTDDKNSVIFEAMFEAMDEYYSLNLSDNVKRGLYEKASRGEFRGNPPFGYTYNKNTKSLDINDEQAETVRFIFDEYIKSHNLMNIVKKLNGSGIRTMHGKLWTQVQIKDILHNIVYIGKIRYVAGGYRRKNKYFNMEGIEIFEGLHKPIVTEETYYKAKELLTISKNIYGKVRSTTKYRHCFSGLIRCFNCGHTLTYNRAKNGYFRCSGYNRGRCPHSNYTKENKMTELILNTLKKHFTEKIDINISNFDEDLEDKIELTNLEISKNQQRKERIKIGYEEGIYELEEYKEKVIEIDNEVERLNTKLKTLKTDIKLQEKKDTVFKATENVYKLLKNNGTPEDLKFIIINEIIEKMVYNKENRELTIYYK